MKGRSYSGTAALWQGAPPEGLEVWIQSSRVGTDPPRLSPDFSGNPINRTGAVSERPEAPGLADRQVAVAISRVSTARHSLTTTLSLRPRRSLYPIGMTTVRSLRLPGPKGYGGQLEILPDDSSGISTYDKQTRDVYFLVRWIGAPKGWRPRSLLEASESNGILSFALQNPKAGAKTFRLNTDLKIARIEARQETAFVLRPHRVGAPRRPDSDVQLYGSMPMYLMQGAQTSRGYLPHNGSPNVHLPSSNLQFDDLLNQDEWANTFLDPSMGLSNGQPPFPGGRSQFAPQGQGMGGWR
ncbi:hypothetical protein EON81_29575 [bacterium]|nr:MAG: hypothetical protein EON81_29575 [bacterium]